jgi:hypothetical protein
MEKSSGTTPFGLRPLRAVYPGLLVAREPGLEDVIPLGLGYNIASHITGQEWAPTGRGRIHSDLCADRG